jgi:hypothetical protein
VFLHSVCLHAAAVESLAKSPKLSRLFIVNVHTICNLLAFDVVFVCQRESMHGCMQHVDANEGMELKSDSFESS